MENHKFLIGTKGCAVCGLRESHVTHKQKKPRMYPTGAVVGRYVVGKNGEFRRVK